MQQLPYKIEILKKNYTSKKGKTIKRIIVESNTEY